MARAVLAFIVVTNSVCVCGQAGSYVHVCSQLSTGTADALDSLSDTLIDATPVPEPAPIAAKDIIKVHNLR